MFRLTDHDFDRVNAALAGRYDFDTGARTCPMCGHHGCFGMVPGTYRWHCFSANHGRDSGGLPASGDLLDLFLEEGLRRWPTRRDRARYVAAALAMGGQRQGEQP